MTADAPVLDRPTPLPVTPASDDFNLRRDARDWPELLPLVLRFNHAVAIDLHADRFAQLNIGPSALCSRLLSSPRGVRKLSRLVIEKAGIDTEPIYDFRLGRHRIALLDRPSLERLLDIAAAAAIADQAARVVQRNQRTQLATVMSSNIWEFAIRRARLTIGPVARRWAGDLQDNQADVASRFVQLRQNFLNDLCCAAPQPLLDRLRLKLPPSFELNCQSAPANRVQAAWKLAQRIAATELEPRWKPCFS